MSDLCFDLRHGVDTALPREVSAAPVVGANRAAAVQYQPVDAALFNRLIGSLPVEHRRYTFVDYGCGKGKALMLAARWRFQRLVGIEFCRPIHAIAERNLSRFQKRLPQPIAVELLCADAAQYEPAAGPSLFFFYNPFNEQVMRQVLARIRSVREHFVVLVNPVTLSLFLAAGYTLSAMRHYGGTVAGVVLNPSFGPA